MEQLKVLTEANQIDEVVEYLKDKEYVAFDTETTGLDKDSEIIGFSIGADMDLAYYIVLSYWDKEQSKLISLDTKTRVQELLAILKTKQLVMHNAIFDCFMVENNFKVKLIEHVHTDTMILGHLLDENRSNGLKELGVSIFGEDAKKEKIEMEASVKANGGSLTQKCYELYKADPHILGKYGAKDAILTMKLFYTLITELYDAGLDSFFYEEESMPLLKGPTYDLNTEGLRIDKDKLQSLKQTLQAENLELQSYIFKEINKHIKDKYPGTNKTNTFNLNSSSQLSWLLFIKLNNEFNTLTNEGKFVCKSLGYKLPYAFTAKKQFIQSVTKNIGQKYLKEDVNKKTKKKEIKEKKYREAHIYINCGKGILTILAKKYKWVEALLKYRQNTKLLTTYVEGIEERLNYGVIRPSFLQHGTTSGRYSSRNPNFQNLPRNDKRVKSCIVARPGNVLVGADYSQLEPRVFASISKDVKLLECFNSGDDFYSVIGQEIFEKYDCSLKKDDEGSFAKKYPDLRDISKVVGLSSTYGTMARKMAPLINRDTEGAQVVIDRYFAKFPGVYAFMAKSHIEAKKNGVVYSLYGRPRRIPKARFITSTYGNLDHSELPYEARTLLNLAVNHKVQSTAASIMNRAAIMVWEAINHLNKVDNPLWAKVKIVLQIHDELVLEGPKELEKQMIAILKDSMENAVELPEVKLIAEPKAGSALSELK